MSLFYGLLEGALMGVGGLSIVIVAFLVIYILGEAEAKRTGTRDPALGAKVAMTLLLTICFQAALIGIGLLLTNVFVGGPGRLSETAMGLILGGALASVMPIVLLVKASAGGGGVNVLRKAVGVNAIVCGLVFTTVLIAFFTALLSGASVDTMLGVLLAYGGGAFATLLPLANVAQATETPAT